MHLVNDVCLSCDYMQTIVDVARQAETSPHGFAYMEGKDLSGETLLFCTKCEVSG